MAVRYNKLWKILIDKKMKKKDLQEAARLTRYQMLKLARDENITTDVVGSICYADMIIRRSSYPSDLCERNIVSELPEFVCRGGSCIIDPYGHYLTKPVWDEETIIYAELDMSLPAACKMEHDAIGHYARPDILELKVNEK